MILINQKVKRWVSETVDNGGNRLRKKDKHGAHVAKGKSEDGMRR